MDQPTSDMRMTQSTLISTKKVAVLVSGLYVFSAVEAVRDLNRAQLVILSDPTPVISVIGYVFCIWFFLEIQRGTKNTLERLAAFTSAAVFIPPLLRLVLWEFHLTHPLLFTSLYPDAVLTIAATMGVIARAIELFIGDHGSSQAAP